MYVGIDQKSSQYNSHIILIISNALSSQLFHHDTIYDIAVCYYGKWAHM